MTDVFISYRRTDLELVKRLAERLKSRGYSVWYDIALDAGHGYRAQIQSALQRAEIVVVLWTPQAVKSPWVKDEARRGLDRGRLVSIKARGVRTEKLFASTVVAEISFPQTPDKDLALAEQAIDAALQAMRRQDGHSPLQRWRPAGWITDFAMTFLLTFAVLAIVGFLSADYWAERFSREGIESSLMGTGLWGLVCALFAMIITPFSVLFASIGELIARRVFRTNIAARTQRLFARWGGEAFGWNTPFIAASLLMPPERWAQLEGAGAVGPLPLMTLTLVFLYFACVFVFTIKYAPVLASRRLKSLILQ